MNTRDEVLDEFLPKFEDELGEYEPMDVMTRMAGEIVTLRATVLVEREAIERLREQLASVTAERDAQRLANQLQAKAYDEERQKPTTPESVALDKAHTLDVMAEELRSLAAQLRGA